MEEPAFLEDDDFPLARRASGNRRQDVGGASGSVGDVARGVRWLLNISTKTAQSRKRDVRAPSQATPGRRKLVVRGALAGRKNRDKPAAKTARGKDEAPR